MKSKALILITTTLLIVGSAVIAYAAVGGRGIATAPGAERLEVDFDEWTLKPSAAALPAGSATIVVSNKGEVDHELLLVRTDLPADQLPQGISGPIAKLAGELVLGEPHRHVSTNDSYALLDREPDANTEDHVTPGREEAYEVDLEPGSYVLYCNLPGHYQRGQYASLEVTRSDQS